jgi:hypothetical protein
MKRRTTTHILSPERDDPKKELELEVAFQLSPSEEQRYAMMKKLSKKSIELMKANDHKKDPSIISRP